MAEHRTRKPEKEKKPKSGAVKTGDRMKETYLRSKHVEKNLSSDGRDDPNDYAVDNTREVGRELVHDTAKVAGNGVKKAVERGRTAAKKAHAKNQENKAQDSVSDLETESLELSDEEKSSAEIRASQIKSKLSEDVGRSHHSEKTQHPVTGGSSNDMPTLQGIHQSRTESIIKKKDEGRKPDLAEPHLNTNPTTAVERPQAPMYPIRLGRHTPPLEGRNANSPSRGIINRTGKGRNSHLPGGSVRAFGQTKQAVRHEQKRQAFMAAKNRTVASARTQRSIQKRIAATVEQTRKAAASISAVAGSAGFVIVILMVTLLLVGTVATSGFGIFFSPDANKNSPDKLPDVMRELNTEFQNKIENIKATVPHDAVEMYGARAVWPEVLSVYAVKTTTDPENGMEVATMNDAKKRILTGIFWDMNEITYTTHTESYTVTVPVTNSDGTVTEKEQTEYFTTLIITVSHLTAEEAAAGYGFSRSQNEELSELVSMDNSLWLAVLYSLVDGAYGEYGEIVQVALSQVGNIGGEPFWSWYGFNSRVEWCACFVSWCAEQCGYIDQGLIPKYAWCPYGVQWFQGINQWIDGSMEPAPGMIIFYDWNKESTNGQDGVSDHTGIVEYVENGIVHTIEGNWGDSVAQRELPVGYYEILGYGFMSGSGE